MNQHIHYHRPDRKTFCRERVHIFWATIMLFQRPDHFMIMQQLLITHRLYMTIKQAWSNFSIAGAASLSINKRSILCETFISNKFFKYSCSWTCIVLFRCVIVPHGTNFYTTYLSSFFWLSDCCMIPWWCVRGFINQWWVWDLLPVLRPINTSLLMKFCRSSFLTRARQADQIACEDVCLVR